MIFSLVRQAPITRAGTINAPATKEFLSWATQKGPILLHLEGEDHPRLRQAVLTALTKPLTSRPVTFTFDPAEVGDTAVRVTIGLNPLPSADPQEMIAGRFASQEQSGRLSMMVALDRRGTLLSWSEGHVGGDDLSPEGKPFAALVTQCLRHIFSVLQS